MTASPETTPEETSAPPADKTYPLYHPELGRYVGSAEEEAQRLHDAGLAPPPEVPWSSAPPEEAAAPVDISAGELTLPTEVGAFPPPPAVVEPEPDPTQEALLAAAVSWQKYAELYTLPAHPVEPEAPKGEAAPPA
jgi:hypothetical protein